MKLFWIDLGKRGALTAPGVVGESLIRQMKAGTILYPTYVMSQSSKGSHEAPRIEKPLKWTNVKDFEVPSLLLYCST